MRITILFGGTNKERLVSVATAQALHSALPEADLWFWDADDSVHETRSRTLLGHTRPFEDPFKPDGRRVGGDIERALDQAKADERLLVLGLHGGRAENGELQVMCEMRGIPFTGSSSASSHLAFDKVAAKRFAALGGVKAPPGIALDDIEAAFEEYGRLVAKPTYDGSSYGLMFVNARQDIVAVRRAAKAEAYLICPGRFAPDISAAIMAEALRAHQALSCGGYSRTDFIVSNEGPIFLETNTLPGLTKASLYPKALKAQGIEFADFLQHQIVLAERRARK